MEPWLELAESTLDRVLEGSPLRALVEPRELAVAAVTFYLGANLLTHLIPERVDVEGVLAAAQRFAPLVDPHERAD
jgi:hypothetical protein